MKFILVLRRSKLLSQHIVTLITFILGIFLILFLAVRQETSPWLLLECHLWNHTAVRIGWICLRVCKYFYLIRSLLSVIFLIHGGQEVTLFFAGKGVIVLIFILNFILHGCWKSILSWNTNVILRELFVADDPIYLILLIPLHQRWMEILS